MRVQEFSSLAVFIAVMSNSGSSFTVVGVNNGSVNAQQAGVRRVLITPLGQTAHQPVIAKVLLKAVTKTGKKKEKVFTLRNINPSNVRSCDELRRLIKHQLSDDVIAEFDVGYVTSTRGEKVISIRSTEDLLELWKDVKSHGDKIQLWCDGLKSEKSQKKRKRTDSDDGNSEDDQPKKKSAREQRDEKLKHAMESLQTKHATNYTPMQYRIWSELHANGMYTDLDNPPNNSMFKRAGATTPVTKKPNNSEFTHAVSAAATQVSTAIVSALTPKSTTERPSASTGISPARIIDNRSKCYRQLSDLQNLKSQGVLSEEDYLREKEAILVILKKLVT